MERIARLLALLCLIVSCEDDIILQKIEDPVLQINAVFYEGEALSDIPILVQQTFSVTGSEPIILDSTDIYVSGAQISVQVNGEPYGVEERAIGQYYITSDRIIASDDRIEIEITFENLTASATALVPRVNPSSLQIVPEDSVFLSLQPFEDEQGNVEEMWYGLLDVGIKVRLDHTYVIVETTSEDDTFLEESGLMNLNSFFDEALFRLEKVAQEDFVGFEFYESTMTAGVLDRNINQEPMSLRDLEIKTRMLVPEDIYYTFITTFSNEFAPVTVTNVTGGVGLFIGCGVATQEQAYRVQVIGIQ